MNFYKLKIAVMVLCLVLLTSASFAQTDDTETPDTSWFTDVTDKVGLGNLTLNGISSMLWLDVNNDDYPDLIVISGLSVDNGWQLFINEERPGSTDPTDRIFVNETAESGLNIPGVYKDLAGAGDFDNDGNVDIVVNCLYWNELQNDCPSPTPNPAKSRLRIFWGNGDGTFTLDSLSNTPNSGLEELGPMSGSALPALDYDRDGYLDFFVACHYNNWCQEIPEPSHLMHNNGNRTFSDSATAAGINISQKDPAKPWLNPPPERALYGANMSDWNNDCWPDIFTCPYEAIGYPGTATHCDYDYGSYYAYAPCNEDTQDTRGYGNLYENLGGEGKIGKFKDVGVTANYDPHFAWAGQGMVPWAAMPADYNNDGNMDYLVLEVHGANYDSSSATVYPNEPGDGRTCIFTNLGPDSNYKLRPDINRIIRNPPINATHGDHVGFWTDFNNDGWQDLVVGDCVYPGTVDNERMFFELQDTTTHDFNDVTAALGYCSGTKITSTITNYKIRRPDAMAPVDYDLDGDDDIFKFPYIWPQDSVLVLRNNIGNRNNHITIKLIAPPGVNKSCIGARITVVSGNLKQMKDIMGEQGQSTSQFAFIQNFGLGKHTLIDTIDVRWPDQDCTHTIVTGVPVNQFIRIDENGISGIMPVGPNAPNNFTLYPNPDAGNTLNIKFTGPINPFIEIYNELGQQVADYQPGYSSLFTLPIGNIPAGLYFVHIIGGPNGTILTKQFIKIITP